MRVTLPDALVDHYETYAKAHGISVDEVIEQQLRRFQHRDPHERLLLLAGEHLANIEGQLKGGILRTPKDLIDRIHRLASLKIGGIEVDFTPAQWEELTRRAEKNGWPIKQEAERIVKAMEDQFFWGTVASVR